MTGRDLEHRRPTRASRRRFKEGQLQPVVRPILGAGCSFFLIVVGLLAVALSGLGPPDDRASNTGWALVGVGVILFLWGAFSGAAKRGRRGRRDHPGPDQ